MVMTILRWSLKWSGFTKVFFPVGAGGGKVWFGMGGPSWDGGNEKSSIFF